MEHRLVVPILVALLFPGCGSGTAASPDPGPADPGPPQDSPRPEIPAEKDPGPDDLGDQDIPRPPPEPLLLLEAQVPDDRGGFDNDPRFPLDPRGAFHRPLRVSPCGTMAMVFRNLKPLPGGTWDFSLVLLQTSPWDAPPSPRSYFAPAVQRAEPPPIAAWISFSQDRCEPRVWRLSDDEPRLVQWVPRPDGSLAPALVLWDLESPLGASPTRLDPVAFGDDRQGGLNLLVRADLGTMGTPLVHLRLQDGAWSVERVPPAPLLAELDRASFAFGGDGALHVATTRPEGLVYGVMKDGAWRQDLPLPSPGEGILLDSVHLALGSYDSPLVAYRRVETLEGGLWQSLRLELAHRPSGGEWQREVLADRNGSWRGDTDRWTGAAPRAAVTPFGRWWVSWLDLARISSGGTTTAVHGGPRLAIREDSGWSVREVLPRSRTTYPPSRFDVAEAVAVDLDPQGRVFGSLVLERERLDGQAPGMAGTAWWRLWLVRGAL